MAAAPIVLALQPFALVDSIVGADAEFVGKHIGGAAGGSLRVSAAELEALLQAALQAAGGVDASRAGGAGTNFARTVALLGVPVGLVGAAGTDDWGVLFRDTVTASGAQLKAFNENT